MKHRIVVLGAGYAGANAAGRLARRLHPADVDITLVNADSEFVERIRMHQVATGQRLRRRSLTDVFAGTGVRVLVARVQAVDADRKTVTLADADGDRAMTYDTLVYALGSAAAHGGVPGVAEYALDIAGKQSALRVRDRLAGLDAGATVLIAGGGLTGIEAASEIADARPDLEVAIAVRGRLGEWLSEKARQHLHTAFAGLVITVHEHTDITRVERDGVVAVDGRTIRSQLTVWTAGFAAHPIAAASTLEVSGSGQIVVDDTMRSISHPDVYAVGDAALASGKNGVPLRMSCASGVPSAQYAADVIAARLAGRAVPRNEIGYSAQCISLGRRDGIVQWVTPDDRPKSSAVTGRSAARLKEFICKSAVWSTSHPTSMMPSRRRRVTAVA
ncbi:NAD(P)/FAD-dependent oxidoreductase [Nocardia cyriacigeorgica]|uniref:NAD(P)/FAD-dependent oxidoreductase n=1 Tax=Nocardia cyriacigeorgica TaxID=135487 RepID=UPI0018933B80|nr:FAD-dependent oxidoreductase [Nocardia cyriacigeorgica]MBF6455282.1 FAD-dependent oxidoreductase [Nocardia cyriacigeorgica]MBF6480531.1 FAD-dependent oxidoreductase [Nocardia cyriacigeorgica]MBF6553976.1 FAD-dependent oxidoreductase [Nocardia cyriacigeorgica]